MTSPSPVKGPDGLWRYRLAQAIFALAGLILAVHSGKGMVHAALHAVWQTPATQVWTYDEEPR